jgi:hypothetical protein
MQNQHKLEQVGPGSSVELSNKATYFIDENGSWRRMPTDKVSWRKFRKRRARTEGKKLSKAELRKVG